MLAQNENNSFYNYGFRVKTPFIKCKKKKTDNISEGDDRIDLFASKRSEKMSIRSLFLNDVFG